MAIMLQCHWLQMAGYHISQYRQDLHARDEWSHLQQYLMVLAGQIANTYLGPYCTWTSGDIEKQCCPGSCLACSHECNTAGPDLVAGVRAVCMPLLCVHELDYYTH